MFLLFVLHKHQGFIMIQDIKPGSQSMSPSLIILGQSIVYAEVVAKQTGPNRRNNRFSAPSDECLRTYPEKVARITNADNILIRDLTSFLTRFCWFLSYNLFWLLQTGSCRVGRSKLKPVRVSTRRPRL